MALNKGELSSAEQRHALRIVRETLAAYFAGEKYNPSVSTDSVLNQPRGAFVTLKINGRLRGCIGLFSSDQPLYKVLGEMALDAALRDNRFSPLSKDELDEVVIEISVLSPMKRINSADEIVMGTHGVYVKFDRQGGTYLPQVAEDFNFDKEKFLNSLCAEKAGLSADCWSDGATELYTYTAQVFAEN